jgi:hypothetical protein
MNLLSWVNPLNLIENFLILRGGGDSGGGGGSQQSTSYSTNLPEYAQPYYQELLKQSGREIFNTNSSGFVTGVKSPANLPQQQVAGFNPLQQQAQQGVANLQTPGQFGQSTTGLTGAQNLSFGAANQGLGTALSYNPQNVQGGTFGQQEADFYSNPYQQNVTDTALREARTQGLMNKQAGAMGAINRGTFGGARQALIQAEQDRGLSNQLSDIQYKGSADAFQNAQQQFNADQARRMQAEQLNQQGQQYLAGIGKDVGLAGLGYGVDSSKALGALGSEQQQAELARLQAQAAAGGEQQALTQKQYDTDFQNAMAKQNYAKQQLEFYSNILRGNAGALGSTQVNYAPAPSTASQVGGLGLAGLSLAQLMK